MHRLKIKEEVFLILSFAEGETEQVYKLLSKEGKTYIYTKYYRSDIVYDEEGFMAGETFTQISETLKEDNDMTVLLESRHFKEIVKFLKG